MRYRSRFLLLFAVLALAAAVFLSAVFDSTLRRALEERVTFRIEHELDHVQSDLKALPSTEWDGYLRRTAQELSCRITLIQADGRVLDDTGLLPGDVPAMENQRNRPEVIAAAQGNEGRSSRGSFTAEPERRFNVARQLLNGDFLRMSVTEAFVRQME